MSLSRIAERMAAQPPAGGRVRVSDVRPLTLHATGKCEVRVVHGGKECLRCTLYQDTTRRVTMHLDELKYHEDPCALSGRMLLSWLMTFAALPGVGSVTLDDASEVILPRIGRFQLRLHRKFLRGRSWYEDFGFQPLDAHERWAYHESFRRVRNAPSDDVRVVVWIALQRVLVPSSRHGLRRLSRNEDDSSATRPTSKGQALLREAVRRLDPDLHASLASEELFRVVHRWSHWLERFLEQHGGVPDATRSTWSQPHERVRAYLEAKAPLDERVPHRCFRDLAFDDDTRGEPVLSDARVHEIRARLLPTYAVLVVFVKLGLLVVPTRFVWTKRPPKTPASTTKPCRPDRRGLSGKHVRRPK